MIVCYAIKILLMLFLISLLRILMVTCFPEMRWKKKWLIRYILTYFAVSYLVMLIHCNPVYFSGLMISRLFPLNLSAASTRNSTMGTTLRMIKELTILLVC